ncbi:putative F-box domain-containing protein [Helianthus annuus]|nr:putative F-box domain-containing protein [Helianthus annuus]KAJ0746898.1 putative F-box domain-containing protein [Helianthus annuus]
MKGAVDRYHKLGLQESLSRSCNYPSACRELALILKRSYSKFPKVLQSIVFQDVLTAFRLLPRMQTQSAISAANTLLQGVESALPKQKKTLAVTEFKQAMVSHKRCSKARHSDEGLVELPQDVLVHIFCFLDLQSLVSASQVCRSWNAASRDNYIWLSIHTMFLNTLHNFSKIDKLYGRLTEHEKSECSQESIACNNNLDWRTNFKKAYNSTPLIKETCYMFERIVHTLPCNRVGHGRGKDTTSRLKCKYHQIKPISTSQIVEYIDGDYASSGSDSDSDSYDDLCSKLWAYPKSGFPV